MALFISYSSRDSAPLGALVSALRRAHEEVWFDNELSGGEAWWGAILQRIRDCEAFIFALSANSLSSKACLSELRYARDLHKPVIPVQIGPVSSMRVTPLADLEAIDFQNPTMDAGIRLTVAVHEARRRAGVLPSPLPEEPPVPFAYLMRLANSITGSGLDARAQATMLAELKSSLDEDGEDATARRDIIQLLCVLRDRPDVTYRIRTEVETLLAQLVSGRHPAPAGPPSSPGFPIVSQIPNTGPIVTAPVPIPPPQPFPAPLSGHRNSGSKRWILAGGGAAAIAAAVLAVTLATAHRDSASESTPGPVPPTSGASETASTSSQAALPPLIRGPDGFGQSCDNGFSVPSQTGPGPRSGRGSPETSCFFAESVLTSYWTKYGSISPETRRVDAAGASDCVGGESKCSGVLYRMTCASRGSEDWVTCTGADNAVVYLY